MATMTQEEMNKAEASLHAEEEVIKKKWCVLKGHRWDLPAVTPFNHDIWECEIICNRCNLHGRLVITDDSGVAVPSTTVSGATTKSAAVKSA